MKEDIYYHCGREMKLIYKLDNIKVYACVMCNKERDVKLRKKAKETTV